MAIPTSGDLGIVTCPGGNQCRSIAYAVDGDTSGSKSLSTLSTSADKSAPHCMREFYGYDPVSGVVCHKRDCSFDYGNSVCEYWSVVVDPELSSGSWTYAGQATVCTHYSMGSSSCASFCIDCNGVTVLDLRVFSEGITCCTESIQIDLNHDDCLEIGLYACVISGQIGCRSEACHYNVDVSNFPSGYCFDDSNMPLHVVACG